MFLKALSDIPVEGGSGFLEGGWPPNNFLNFTHHVKP